VELTTHLHPVPRSRISEAIPPLTQYAFMAWCSIKSTGETLPLLDGSQWSGSWPDRFTHGEEPPVLIEQVGGWMSPTVGLEAMAKEKKILYFRLPGIEPRSSTRYTHRAARNRKQYRPPNCMSVCLSVCLTFRPLFETCDMYDCF